MTNRTPLVFLIIGAVAACRANDSSPPQASGSASTSAPVPRPAQAALDEMDGRTPVPLLPMMANHQKQNLRDHLRAVQEIAAALATKDFGSIEKAAGRIGYSEQMGQICTHMGAGAPGFTDAALTFHHTADTIGEAAKRRDPDAVLTALNNTLATCTSCHATYRQSVVDEATWASLTQETMPNGLSHEMMK